MRVVPTSVVSATACLLRDERVTWSKSMSLILLTPERMSILAAWLPTPPTPTTWGDEGNDEERAYDHEGVLQAFEALLAEIRSYSRVELFLKVNLRTMTGK
jgi:hypothetical protein